MTSKEFEKKVLGLATSHKNEPDIFIQYLEDLLEKSNIQEHEKKKDCLVHVGELLLNNSNLLLQQKYLFH